MWLNHQNIVLNGQTFCSYEMLKKSWKIMYICTLSQCFFSWFAQKLVGIQTSYFPNDIIKNRSLWRERERNSFIFFTSSRTTFPRALTIKDVSNGWANHLFSFFSFNHISSYVHTRPGHKVVWRVMKSHIKG